MAGQEKAGALPWETSVTTTSALRAELPMENAHKFLVVLNVDEPYGTAVMEAPQDNPARPTAKFMIKGVKHPVIGCSRLETAGPVLRLVRNFPATPAGPARSAVLWLPVTSIVFVFEQEDALEEEPLEEPLEEPRRLPMGFVPN